MTVAIALLIEALAAFLALELPRLQVITDVVMHVPYPGRLHPIAKKARQHLLLATSLGVAPPPGVVVFAQIDSVMTRVIVLVLILFGVLLVLG